MTVELQFSIQVQRANDQELRERISGKQPIETAKSDESKNPDSVVVKMEMGTMSLIFHGVDLSDLSDESLDEWSASVTDQLNDAVEISRRSFER